MRRGNDDDVDDDDDDDDDDESLCLSLSLSRSQRDSTLLFHPRLPCTRTYTRTRFLYFSISIHSFSLLYPLFSFHYTVSQSTTVSLLFSRRREREKAFVRTYPWRCHVFACGVADIYSSPLSLSLSLSFCLALSRRLCANVHSLERERERKNVLFSRSSKGDSPGFYPAAVAETFFSLSRG